MNETKKVSISELIELHLELKGEGLHISEDHTNPLFDENTLPPRREIFPAKKPRLTRIFYNTLFVLFLVLVIGLTIWGARMN